MVDKQERNPNQTQEPFLFNIKKPIHTFCGRTEEIEDVHRILDKNHIVTLSGLAGIGKTELVRKYIEKYNDAYENQIIWINADSKERIYESYKQFCVNKLGISSRDVDGNCKDFQTLYESICKGTSKLLIVYDNAYKFDIRLPSGNIYIIVTSRNKKQWSKISEIIDLNVLNETEAVEFINKSLNTQHDAEHVVNLAKKLEFFPLILQQATIYINETDTAYRNIGREYTIEDYLKEFDLDTEKLLRYNVSTFIDYNETLYTIWSNIFDLISTNSEYGKVAIEILDVLCFLESSNIPVNYFIHSNCTESDKRKLCFGLELLKDYSIISTGDFKTSININSLVQLVRRLHMKSNGMYDSVKMNLFSLNLDILENKKNIHDWFTHLDVFLEYLYKDFISYDFNYATLMLYFIEKLSDTYRKLGEYRRLKNISKRALLFLDKYYRFEYMDINDVLSGKNNETLKLQIRYTPEQICIVRVIVNLITGLKGLGDYKRCDLLQKKCVKNLAFVLSFLKTQFDTREMFFSDFLYDIGDRNLVMMKNLAIHLCDFGEYTQATELLERVLKVEMKLYESSDDFRSVQTLNNLALVVVNTGNLERARGLLEKCLQICKSRSDFNNKSTRIGYDIVLDTDIELNVVLNNLAVILIHSDEYKKSEKILKYALRIEEKRFGFDDIRLRSVLHNLAVVLEYKREYIEQKEVVERILYITEQYYGLDHIETGKILYNLARVNGFLGYVEEKIRLLNGALDIEESFYRDTEHIDLVLILKGLAEAYGNLGDYNTKKNFLERVLTIQETFYDGTFSNEIVETLFDLAIVAGVLNELDEQRVLLEKCLNIIVPVFGYRQIYIAIVENALGNVSVLLEDYRKAELYFNRALRDFENYYGEESFYTSIVLKNLARVYDEIGDNDEKLRLMARVECIEQNYYFGEKDL